MIQNPYESPTSIATAESKVTSSSFRVIRWMSGLLAGTGVVFLPSLNWIVSNPFGIAWWCAWLCWLLIAVGVKKTNSNWLWLFTLGYGAAGVEDCPPGPSLIVVHFTLAVVFSLSAIALNLLRPERVLMTWANLKTLFVAPVLLIWCVPPVYRFVAGPPKYRVRWLGLQLSAIAAAIATWAVSVILIHKAFGINTDNSIGYSAVGAFVIGIGLYIYMMTRMPAQFYDEGPIAIRVKEFLGADDHNSVRAKSKLALIACFLLGAGIMAIPILVFGNAQ